MPTTVTLTIDGPDVPLGFKANWNKFLQFLRENWGGSVALGNTGVLPGQIGGVTPTTNVGVFVNGRNIEVWDDSLARYVSATSVPIGCLIPFMGADNLAANIPNYLPCDGRILQNTDPDFTQLFAVIGFLYGKSGDTGFMLPDPQGRYVCGAGTGDYVKNTDVVGTGKITTRILGDYFGFEWPRTKVNRQTTPPAPVKVTGQTSPVLNTIARTTFLGTCPPTVVCRWLIRVN